ncbi:uncharacterized protein LOC134527394 isoform X2 [Bacillus rossius redtenbacheri]|uniref:uncharacterized protein LOC134527394 isoform X2 n=1 Tax=Bacillus rossius redtenbacheri TaxID=93214 RepID=UPI002FDDF658
MRVRKRSAIHLCLAGGLLLLIAQLALLCVLLRPTARPADFPAADVAALSNTSATLGLHLLLADTRVLPGACPLTFVALPRAGGTVKVPVPTLHALLDRVPGTEGACAM